jgi:hypothetical protein
MQNSNYYTDPRNQTKILTWIYSLSRKHYHWIGFQEKRQFCAENSKDNVDPFAFRSFKMMMQLSRAEIFIEKWDFATLKFASSIYARYAF